VRLRRKTEKERCPIQFELGTFDSTTMTLYASGASIGDDVQVQVLFRALKKPKPPNRVVLCSCISLEENLPVLFTPTLSVGARPDVFCRGSGHSGQKVLPLCGCPFLHLLHRSSPRMNHSRSCALTQTALQHIFVENILSSSNQQEGPP